MESHIGSISFYIHNLRFYKELRFCKFSFYCRETEILPTSLLEPSNRRTSNSQSRATSLVESDAILFTLLLEFTHVVMWVWRLACASQSHVFNITIENFDYHYCNNSTDDNDSRTIFTIASPRPNPGFQF